MQSHLLLLSPHWGGSIQTSPLQPSYNMSSRPYPLTPSPSNLFHTLTSTHTHYLYFTIAWILEDITWARATTCVFPDSFVWRVISSSGGDQSSIPDHAKFFYYVLFQISWNLENFARARALSIVCLGSSVVELSPSTLETIVWFPKHNFVLCLVSENLTHRGYC